MSNVVTTDALGISEGLGIDWDVFIDDPSVLLPRTNNLTLNLGDPRSFTAKLLNGTEVEASAELTEPGRLMRVHKIRREPEGREGYWLTSYVIHGAKVAIMVIDPKTGERVELSELYRQIFNANLQGVPDYDRQRFQQFMAAKLGMRPDGQQNWFGMQMGAMESRTDGSLGTDETLEMLRSHGAKDAKSAGTEWGGIQEVWAIDRDEVLRDGAGPLITSVEVGAMDRSLTQSKLGFQDLVNAGLENLASVLGVVGTVGYGYKALKKRIDENDQSLNDDEIRRIKGELELLERNGRAYRSTFGGATPHFAWNEAHTELNRTDTFDPVSIPGGRMNFVAKDGKEGLIDLWQPRRDQRGEGGNSTTDDTPGLDIGALASSLGGPEVPDKIVVNQTTPSEDASEDEANEVVVDEAMILAYRGTLDNETGEIFDAYSDEEKVEEVTKALAERDPDEEPF